MKGSGLLAWLLYLAVRVIFALMQIFPLERNLRTARWAARIWIWVMPRHLDRAIANLTMTLGRQFDDRSIRRMAVGCLESCAMFTVEAMSLPRLITPWTWTRYIRLVNFQDVLRRILEKRGLILVTAHYGSFELVGHLFATLGFDTVAVMRPFDNDYLNEYLVRTRRMRGLELLDKKGAMMHAEAVLARGGLLGFIGDQDAGRKGHFVDFFGVPASTYKSIALLAMQAEVPIVVGYVRRRGNSARYEIGAERIIDPIEWQDESDPVHWITQTFSSAIESFIRVAPEQYWWLHRRWKSQPRAAQSPRLMHRLSERLG
jgi:KDO2-lipid IV(A) lauroyltransferase